MTVLVCLVLVHLIARQLILHKQWQDKVVFACGPLVFAMCCSLYKHARAVRLDVWAIYICVRVCVWWRGVPATKAATACSSRVPFVALGMAVSTSCPSPSPTIGAIAVVVDVVVVGGEDACRGVRFGTTRP